MENYIRAHFSSQAVKLGLKNALVPTTITTFHLMAIIIWRTIFERSFLDTICFSSSRDPGDASAFFQKSALNSPTITTLPYVGTISWEIYLVLSHGKIYMALSHGKSIWYYLMEKSIWHYLMENLFGIISWKIYLVLSHGKYIWHYLIVGSTSAVCHRMNIT